jgi:ATP-dependent Lon protease
MYGIADDYFTKHDIHLHIPEGATPKDGPSAGITMAVGVLSAVTERKITRDLAMTGEITLRGRVLPIGGLKEKLLAAKAAEISRVLVPAENKKDVEELEEEVTQKIEICFVDSMKEVIRYAFV